MSEFLGPLLSERAIIDSVLTSRKKKVIEKSIKASSDEILNEKLLLEERDGWKLVRKNIASIRMSMLKPLDEQLEDEIWCFLAQMKFNEMSDGRQFKIFTDHGVEPRQIDVYAKDDEVALFVECTHRESYGKKNMGPLIDKIGTLREKVSKTLLKHYGRDAKLKQGWIIATRNVQWTNADLQKAVNSKIVIFTDNEIDYYKKITQLYKLGAKYQLLSHVFSNEKIQGLELVVPATRGKMGGINFYNFLISPLDLIKISRLVRRICG